TSLSLVQGSYQNINSLDYADIEEAATVSGTLNITDVDAAEAPAFENTTIEGEYGSLTLVDGEWTYTVDTEKAQSLGEDQTATDTITLTATDGTTQNIDITVAGVDEASEVSGVFTGVVNEGDLGDTVSISGSISITDVDSDDTPEFQDTTVTGQYGSLDLVDGVWTYTVDNEKTQELDTGTSVKDTITLTATDGTTQDVVISVTG
ncbi:VCBS domain-containing protein, partial [Enterovibrio norvegicus]|uniref:VCBS domain-containing protein n=1 Tax=Enterovibrio norvegicus TaxID=188144 RepID=UPI0018EE2955